MSWNEGYIVDTDYTPGYYEFLQPSRMQFMVQVRGYEPTKSKGFSYCELGSGFANTTNILAATNPKSQFTAVDFNARHITSAANVAKHGKLSNAEFIDCSFSEFLERGKEQYDYMGIHGIYSWVAPSIRQDVVNVMGNKVAREGTVMLSYNTMPGWSPISPIRELFFRMAKDKAGDRRARFSSVLDLVLRMQEVGASFFASNPVAAGRVKSMKEQGNNNYAIHEYLNEHWYPLYFQDVQQEVAPSRMTYAGDAEPNNQIDLTLLSEEQRKILSEVGDAVLRETMRDFFRGTWMRHDLYIRGPARLDSVAHVTRFMKQRLLLVEDPEKFEPTLTMSRGTYNLKEELYRPIVDALADGPLSLEELRGKKGMEALQPNNLREIVLVLMSRGTVTLARSEQEVADCKTSVDNFNTGICKAAGTGVDFNYLASPVTGGGIQLGWLEQLFYYGAKTKKDGVKLVKQRLTERGDTMLVDGRALADPKEIDTALQERFTAFEKKFMPIAKVHNLL